MLNTHYLDRSSNISSKVAFARAIVAKVEVHAGLRDTGTMTFDFEWRTAIAQKLNFVNETKSANFRLYEGNTRLPCHTLAIVWCIVFLML